MFALALLYPSDPFDRSVVDEAYAAEATAARTAGVECFTFSYEDFLDTGKVKIRPFTDVPSVMLYRGWMMQPLVYAMFESAVCASGHQLLISPECYTSCHHLPGWYGAISDLTPETIILDSVEDVSTAISNANWPEGYFVKDFVKSLTTTRGSIAHSAQEAEDIIRQIEHFRGGLDGGVCIRRVEQWIPGREDRYFIFQGVPYGQTAAIPTIVEDVASRISSEFFSVDIAYRLDGTPRVVEIGDGQVSGIKDWSPDLFVRMFT